MQDMKLVVRRKAVGVVGVSEWESRQVTMLIETKISIDPIETRVRPTS